MNNKKIGFTQGAKLFFSLFMVLFYLGVAVLMAINFFDWPPTRMGNGIRWFFAIVLGAYGIYRGYREYKGEHTYGMRRQDLDEGDEPQYGRYTTPYSDQSNNSGENEDNK